MYSRMWAPYLVLAAGIAVSTTASLYVRQKVEERAQSRFDIATARIQHTIEDRLETYLALLLGAKGLFAASDEVTREEFQRFVHHLEIPQHYRGIQGMGYTVRLKEEEAGRLESRIRREGLHDFHVWPLEPQRAEYHSIVFLEPMDRRNRAAIGYDMFTEPVRRNAMERARDTGLPAMSGKVTLVQEIDQEKQPGFLIYIPIYANRGSPSTAGQRREELISFVYSPFRAGDLLKGIIGDETVDLDIQIYDGEDRTAQNQLYSSDGITTDLLESPSRFKTSLLLEIAGRPWTIAKGGSVTAAFHRGWINIKSLVMGGDDDAIVAECERGEDAALENYQRILKQNLPTNVLPVVKHQYTEIKRSHDRLRDMEQAA